jgi:hypothetical protein
MATAWPRRDRAESRRGERNLQPQRADDSPRVPLRARLRFAVIATPRTRMVSALTGATAMPIPDSVIAGCATAARKHANAALDLAETAFTQVFQHGIGTVPPTRRGGLHAVAGNVAEAVVRSLLVESGWHPLFDDASVASGGHGVDLLMLTPDISKVVAVEVKSTFQLRRWPRLARGDVQQLAAAWLDGAANQGMTGNNLDSDDVYGMIAFVHFARRQWKAAVSHDLDEYRPILHEDELGAHSQISTDRLASVIGAPFPLRGTSGWPRSSQGSVARQGGDVM